MIAPYFVTCALCDRLFRPGDGHVHSDVEIAQWRLLKWKFRMIFISGLAVGAIATGILALVVR